MRLRSLFANATITLFGYFHSKDWAEVMSTCFVLMPFSSDFKNQWELAFVPAIESVKLTPYRGDEESLGTNMIMKDVTQSIYNAQIIVADLTGRNPNVMYELGLAHAAKKPVIMLAQSEDDIPFDIRHIRYIKYNEKDLNKLRSELAVRIQSTLSQTSSYDVDFFPQLRLMSDQISQELAYLQQKAVTISIDVSPNTADIFFNDRLLKPGTRNIRVNPAVERNTISAAELYYLDYHEVISRDDIEARRIYIRLERRDRSDEGRLGVLERRVPRWLRYRRRDPNNPVLMRGICQYLDISGQSDEAEAEARDLVETCPNWWLAHYNMGHICATKGQYDVAIPYFSHSVALRSDIAFGYLALACMHALKHEYKETIIQLSLVESKSELLESYRLMEDWVISTDSNFDGIKEDKEFSMQFNSIVHSIEEKAKIKRI